MAGGRSKIRNPRALGSSGFIHVSRVTHRQMGGEGETASAHVTF